MFNLPPMIHDKVFWYTLAEPTIKKLDSSLSTDAVVIGGGVAGLSTAQTLSSLGLSVVLLEKDYCGAGASGKSSGFVTPDSELGIKDFAQLFGKEKAEQIWNLGIQGVDRIRNNINTYSMNCDYQVQDSLFVASSLRGIKKIKEEYEAYLSVGPARYYEREQISSIIGTNNYFGGVRFGGTFGISSYLYCQALRNVLEQQGVQIFEQANVTHVDRMGAYTQHYSVKAKHIIICVDRFLPDFGILQDDVYHAQTFLAVSKPLSENEIKQLFPEQRFLVWDSELIYQYFRMIKDNRFLIGGGQLINTYALQENHHATSVFNKLSRYVHKLFPQVKFEFEYFWPGLISISKNLVPIASQHPQYNNIYFVAAAEGLPWATALGNYVAQKIVDGRSDLDNVFTSQRTYAIGKKLQGILGKRLTFAICNGIVELFD